MTLIYKDYLCELSDIYVTELGYIIIRLYNTELKVFHKINIGYHNEEDNFILDAIKRG